MKSTLIYLLLISVGITLVKTTKYIYTEKTCKALTEKRKNDPVLLAAIKVGMWSETAFSRSCMFPLYTEQLEDEWLFEVGLYIAAHKYFVTDPRFGGNRKPDFYKKFPSPALTGLDPYVKQHCETNATECITKIYQKALKSGTIRQFENLNLNVPAWAPFKSEYEAFVFRQTAMYYLCWHTMQRDPALIFRFKEPPSFFKTDPNMRYDVDLTCHGYLYMAKEIEPASKRQMLVQTRQKSTVKDYRSNYKRMAKEPFMCAELWFCPDPCYPRIETAGFNRDENLRQYANPCKELKNPVCNVVPEANVNFKDLISNKFNISCDCQSNKKGYFWRSPDNRCEDINECEDQNICPFGKTCVNLDGSYQCVCPPGAVENKATTICETKPRKPEPKVALLNHSPPEIASTGKRGSVAFPADSSGIEESISLEHTGEESAHSMASKTRWPGEITKQSNVNVDLNKPIQSNQGPVASRPVLNEPAITDTRFNKPTHSQQLFRPETAVSETKFNKPTQSQQPTQWQQPFRPEPAVTDKRFSVASHPVNSIHSQQQQPFVKPKVSSEIASVSEKKASHETYAPENNDLQAVWGLAGSKYATKSASRNVQHGQAAAVGKSLINPATVNRLSNIRATDNTGTALNPSGGARNVEELAANLPPNIESEENMDIQPSSDTEEEGGDEDTGNFLSGFLAFVSVGTRHAPTALTFLLGQFCAFTLNVL